MQAYEQLGVFYLGRQYDLERQARLADLLLYDSRHLVTHGLVVGMTGSGKTGLCFNLIEEAALDGVPALVIDPKGDLGNLLLTFPDLKPADFAPWINSADARRLGLSEASYAAQQAALWRDGLAAWGQDGERIRRLRAAAEFALYTPGSTAGRPVSILRAFEAPAPGIIEDPELLREQVTSTVEGLLTVAGVKSDPVRSREGILLAHLIERSWLSGRAVDLPGLIQQVQTPPFEHLGVMALETFFAAKDRFELAMLLNRLLASPTFGAWSQGEPLDVSRMLFRADGKPRVAIFSISHLGDAERTFFVAQLLHQVSAWMRTQPGTGSLRAILYMDEIAGYFPPVANPPSKRPLLTLLKQGRAFGIGVVLATQNPVDLDYKGLANIGTWFIGRLQTARDRARVLEGLEGAAAGQGTPLDRVAAERILAGLGNRVFLLHNVHDKEPLIFESRWAMSYLRGPLSRAQVRALTTVAASDPAPASRPAGGRTDVSANGTAEIPVGDTPPAQPAVLGSWPSRVPDSWSSTLPNEARAAGAPALVAGQGAGTYARPVLPPGIQQVFLPVRLPLPAGTRVVCRPRLLGAAAVRFAHASLRVEATRDVLAAVEIGDGPVPVDWSGAMELPLGMSDLTQVPLGADYASVPAAATDARRYAAWAKDFVHWITTQHKLVLFRSPALRTTSELGETERDFRIRLQQSAREQRDAAAEKLRQAYAPRLAALEARLRRAQAAQARESAQANRARLDTVVSLGSTLLGAFLGRKAFSSRTVGRAARTLRSAGRALDQADDVGRTQETVETVHRQRLELETRFQSEVQALMVRLDPTVEQLETITLRPSRGQVHRRLLTLAWLPFAEDSAGNVSPLF